MPGNSTLHSREKRDWHHIARKDLLEGATRCVVDVVSLDEATAEIAGRFALLKIDVEGAELDVLQGGTATLERTDR